MDIKNAIDYREEIIALLTTANLPTKDLPASLENFVVAIIENDVAGAAGLEMTGNHGLIRSVVVRPDMRGKGIAAKLLLSLNELCRLNHITELYLVTETAVEYFEKSGFVKVERHTVPDEIKLSSEFSYVCPQSAIVMKRTLN